MKARCLLAVLTGLAVALMVETPVAEDLPWVGRWAAPDCGPESTQIRLGRDELDLSTFEATCSVQGSRKVGPGYEIDAACAGEGAPYPITLVVRITGETLTFTRQAGFEFDPKNFVRCRETKP